MRRTTICSISNDVLRHIVGYLPITAIVALHETRDRTLCRLLINSNVLPSLELSSALTFPIMRFLTAHIGLKTLSIGKDVSDAHIGLQQPNRHGAMPLMQSPQLMTGAIPVDLLSSLPCRNLVTLRLTGSYLHGAIRVDSDSTFADLFPSLTTLEITETEGTMSPFPQQRKSISARYLTLVQRLPQSLHTLKLAASWARPPVDQLPSSITSLSIVHPRVILFYAFGEFAAATGYVNPEDINAFPTLRMLIKILPKLPNLHCISLMISESSRAPVHQMLQYPPHLPMPPGMRPQIAPAAPRQRMIPPTINQAYNYATADRRGPVSLDPPTTLHDSAKADLHLVFPSTLDTLRIQLLGANRDELSAVLSAASKISTLAFEGHSALLDPELLSWRVPISLTHLDLRSDTTGAHNPNTSEYESLYKHCPPSLTSIRLTNSQHMVHYTNEGAIKDLPASIKSLTLVDFRPQAAVSPTGDLRLPSSLTHLKTFVTNLNLSNTAPSMMPAAAAAPTTIERHLDWSCIPNLVYVSSEFLCLAAEDIELLPRTLNHLYCKLTRTWIHLDVKRLFDRIPGLNHFSSTRDSSNVYLAFDSDSLAPNSPLLSAETLSIYDLWMEAVGAFRDRMSLRWLLGHVNIRPPSLQSDSHMDVDFEAVAASTATTSTLRPGNWMEYPPGPAPVLASPSPSTALASIPTILSTTQSTPSSSQSLNPPRISPQQVSAAPNPPLLLPNDPIQDWNPAKLTGQQRDVLLQRHNLKRTRQPRTVPMPTAAYPMPTTMPSLTHMPSPSMNSPSPSEFLPSFRPPTNYTRVHIDAHRFPPSNPLLPPYDSAVQGLIASYYAPDITELEIRPPADFEHSQTLPSLSPDYNYILGCKSLTKLHIEDTTANFTVRSFSDLPSSLTSLVLHSSLMVNSGLMIGAMPALSVKAIPPGLTRLHIEKCSIAPPTADIESRVQWPQNLTSLRFRSDPHNPWNLSQVSDLARDLPHASEIYISGAIELHIGHYFSYIMQPTLVLPSAVSQFSSSATAVPPTSSLKNPPSSPPPPSSWPLPASTPESPSSMDEDDLAGEQQVFLQAAHSSDDPLHHPDFPLSLMTGTDSMDLFTMDDNEEDEILAEESLPAPLIDAVLPAPVSHAKLQSKSAQALLPIQPQQQPYAQRTQRTEDLLSLESLDLGSLHQDMEKLLHPVKFESVMTIRDLRSVLKVEKLEKLIVAFEPLRSPNEIVPVAKSSNSINDNIRIVQLQLQHMARPENYYISRPSPPFCITPPGLVGELRTTFVGFGMNYDPNNYAISRLSLNTGLPSPVSPIHLDALQFASGGYSSLRHLQISSVPLSLEQIMGLPQSLTHLSVVLSDDELLDPFSYFPPRLETLEIDSENAVNLSSLGVKKISPLLKTLRCNRLRMRPHAATALPLSLTTILFDAYEFWDDAQILEFGNRWVRAGINDFNITAYNMLVSGALLPSDFDAPISLYSLFKHTSRLLGSNYDCRWVGLNGSDLKMPDSVSSLDMTKVALPTIPPRLPSQLHTLKLRLHREISSAQLESLWPQSLTELEIQFTSHCDIDPWFWATLPRQLLHLSLIHVSDLPKPAATYQQMYNSDASGDHLPTILHFDPSFYQHSVSFAAPPTFKISSSLKAMPGLPENLETLKLPNFRLSSDCFDFLGPHLKYLSVYHLDQRKFRDHRLGKPPITLHTLLNTTEYSPPNRQMHPFNYNFGPLNATRQPIPTVCALERDFGVKNTAW